MMAWEKQGKTRILKYRFFMTCVGLLLLVSNCTCHDDIQEFVWKGRDAISGEVPWQAAFVFKDKTGLDKLRGGGIIIDENWILTAAHLFRDYDRENDLVYAIGKDELDVLTGTNDLLSSKKSIGIESIIIPADYRSCGAFNDIALVKLSERLVLGVRDQRYIYAPNSSQYHRYTRPGTELKVSGWGHDENSDIQRKLQIGGVPVAEHGECREANFRVNNIVTGNMLCAGYELSGGTDTCSGDSGGPLYALDEEGNPILIGITSWGEGCSSSGLYGIYTNVYLYIDWVNENCGDCLKYIVPDI